MLGHSATGVIGLDAVLCGGFPSGRTTIVAGGPGSGKTVLALQYLIAGAVDYGEPGLLVSFEESPEALERNWRGMALSLTDVLGKSVHIIDGRIPDDAIEAGTFDLGALIAVVALQAQKLGIKRLAVDGIDALFALDGNAHNRRREILRVLSWLTQSGLTALLTMKGEEGTDGVPPRFGFIDFAADGVVQLHARAIDEFLRRTLSVVKLRGAGFVSGEHPYTVSNRGLTVLMSPRRTRIAKATSLATKLSTGIERLDRMLEGGYRSGTLTLLSGLPGTSKTTLGATFLWAGLVAGERVQFVGFDEPAEQMIFDARSLGIELEPYVAAGLLRADSFAACAVVGDEHYLAIEALVDEHRPSRVVIDPISALVKAGGPDIADSVTERLAVLFKSRGITSVLTAVSDSRQGELEATPTRVSTVADTWIHLSFAAQQGERNRTLTVIKARGTAHSNQLREVLLSHEGVTLAGVYSSGGEVLLGTARLLREQEDAAQRTRDAERAVVELRTLDEARDALTKEVSVLRNRLSEVDERRAELERSAAARVEALATDAAAVREARSADPVA